MALINWNESLQLGFDAIDAQHQNLVQITNELHTSMLVGKSKMALGDLLSRLAAYTQYHFGFEEQLFRQHRYPKIAEHTAQHASLAKKVLGYKTQFDSGNTVLSVEIMEFLRDWLTKHISVSDREFVAHLNTRQPAPRHGF
jgi:hemerythrin